MTMTTSRRPRQSLRQIFLARATIGQSVTLGREEVRNRIAQTSDYFLAHGISDPATAHRQAIVALGKAVKHQALVMGFSDTFAVIGVVLMVAALAVLLTRKVKGAAGGAH